MALFPLLVACFAVVYEASGQAYLPSTMIEALDAALFLNSFKAMALSSGYGGLLNSTDFNGTVFAPVDAAFATVASLDGPPSDLSANITAGNSTIVSDPLNPGKTNTSIIGKTIAFHIVQGVKAFPLSALKEAETLTSMEGSPLYVDRSVPGVVHIYGNVPSTDPANFGTILQYQEIKNGKAVLYVIDKVLAIPKTP